MNKNTHILMPHCLLISSLLEQNISYESRKYFCYLVKHESIDPKQRKVSIIASIIYVFIYSRSLEITSEVNP